MNTLKSAANYVTESVKGGSAEAQKEAHKQVAKDPNASLSTRASATKDMISDKMDQHQHNAQADLHKEAAKH